MDLTLAAPMPSAALTLQSACVKNGVPTLLEVIWLQKKRHLEQSGNKVNWNEPPGRRLVQKGEKK